MQLYNMQLSLYVPNLDHIDYNIFPIQLRVLEQGWFFLGDLC